MAHNMVTNKSASNSQLNEQFDPLDALLEAVVQHEQLQSSSVYSFPVPVPVPALSAIFPTISLNLPNHILISKFVEAASAGAILLTDIGTQVPFVAIREAFCRLYDDSNLTKNQLAPLSPTRGVFKHFGYLDNAQVDQKAVLDLSPDHIETIQTGDFNLGPSFHVEIIPFHRLMVQQIIPRLTYVSSIALTAGGIDFEGNYCNAGSEHICSIHSNNNVKFRLVDFYPIRRTRKRCSEHKDYSTFTIIFQDKRQGGLEIFVGNKWVEVPTECEAVFLWGWSAQILSNSRVKAALHRVVPFIEMDGKKAERRNEAVFYVAPDLEALLHPIVMHPLKETLKFKVSSLKDLTVGKFKNMFGLKWHQREGTLTTEEKLMMASISLENQGVHSSTSQDEDITEYLCSGKVPLAIKK